jgi:hypothetical protein
MISIIIPIAYDYKYAFNAIACCYTIADEIILGIDSKRISWSGNHYIFDEKEFKLTIDNLDIENKIKIIEGNFHTSRVPIQNETIERNFLSLECKPDNWIVQIDSDEYILNPSDFKVWLGKADPELDVYAEWLTVYKVFGDTCLVIREPHNFVPFATKRRNQFALCRDTKMKAIKSNAKLLHYSWGRSKDELIVKLNNWGHSHDFDIKKYLDTWDTVNMDNYKIMSNFHPLHGPLWHSLHAINIPPLHA